MYLQCRIARVLRETTSLQTSSSVSRYANRARSNQTVSTRTHSQRIIIFTIPDGN